MTARSEIAQRIVHLTLAGVLLVLAACGSAPGPGGRSPVELTNPSLGPAHASWLVGPAAHLASPEEIEGFLALRRDEDAEAFIEEFWRRRDPRPEEPGNPLRQLFELRAEEADRRFREAGYVGRRTARGTLWVLHGAPEKVEFELHPHAGEPPIEVWRYPRDAPRGLDGRQPRLVYRFVKQDDLTVAYDGPIEHGPRPPGRPGGRTPGVGWPR